MCSQKGEGTRFRVFLPVGQMLSMPGKDVESVLLVRSNVMGMVLVVDDEMIRETMVMMLECFGYEVLVAEDGASGVEVYRQNQHAIQAVLLDMTMPKMNGLQCFQQLKGINSDVKVFYLRVINRNKPCKARLTLVWRVIFKSPTSLKFWKKC